MVPRTYDEAAVQIFEQALDDAWQVLRQHDPGRDWDVDKDLSEEISRMLRDSIDAGVTDSQELCRKVLSRFNLKPSH